MAMEESATNMACVEATSIAEMLGLKFVPAKVNMSVEKNIIAFTPPKARFYKICVKVHMWKG